MRLRTGSLLSLSLAALLTLSASAEHPFCGTGPENDERVRALRLQTGRDPRLATHTTGAPALLRDGAFYLAGDETVAVGQRFIDVVGKSLVFAPRPGSKFAVRQEPLRYVEPGDAIHDFETRTGSPWHYRAFDLTKLKVPLFGQTVSRVYLSAFNGIHLVPPDETATAQFNDLDAAVYPQPLISPLMITARRPARLAFPTLHVRETDEMLVVTWRSSAGETFGYDVQAEVHKDGTIVYSYREMREMRWGAPILTAGFQPSAVATSTLAAVDNPANNTRPGIRANLTGMLDLRRIEILRIDDSDLFKLRIQVRSAVDRSLLNSGELVEFVAQMDGAVARLAIDSTGFNFRQFHQSISSRNDPAVVIEGNVIEIHGIQLPANLTTRRSLIVWAIGPSFQHADSSSMSVTFDPPQKRVATDLSALSQDAEVALPVTEPFLLGALDVDEVWARLQPAFALSDYAIDAVAIYQNFYTDLIFFASAYASGGNAQVDGIRAASPWTGSAVPRAPTLLHMNHFKYSFNTQEGLASRVLLHEIGHRWLYFFSIRDGEQNSNVLNPAGAHPAAYVHTPAAFPLHTKQDSSVMGGAFFEPLGDGSYLAHAKNSGFSWTDLYLMGLAAPEEVAPWHYLANTIPQLPSAYWPMDGTIVQGERREVNVGQIVSAHGARNPGTGLSQKRFRVAFVLVRDGSAEPTSEEIAKMSEFRAMLERDFVITTGGRGRVDTVSTEPPRRRSVR